MHIMTIQSKTLRNESEILDLFEKGSRLPKSMNIKKHRLRQFKSIAGAAIFNNYKNTLLFIHDLYLHSVEIIT